MDRNVVCVRTTFRTYITKGDTDMGILADVLMTLAWAVRHPVQYVNETFLGGGEVYDPDKGE